MRLLLLSNSKNYGMGYLEHARDAVGDFLGDAVREVLFVPYAGVRISYDDYATHVRAAFEPLGYRLTSIHEAEDPVAAVREAEAVAVGGGNTFHLVHELYANGVMDAIRDRVRGGAPYLGWSAGSNVACPTLRTTNDMPIVEPPSFRTLGLMPFQINPHYLDAHPDHHMGETREDRIAEFLVVNPDVYVVGLREGSLLRRDGGALRLLGPKPMRVFRHGTPPREVEPGDDLTFLWG
ncbi:dipeptidase PepE [Rhodocaloribacter sp.]